jgi:hypothetical protein
MYKSFREGLVDLERFSSPVDVVIAAVKLFSPSQIWDAPRVFDDGSRNEVAEPSLLEDRYQKELYRCLTLVWPGVLISPEFIITPRKSSTSTHQGTVDFYLNLAPKREGWMIEFLRDSDRVEAHLERFVANGRYEAIARDSIKETWIVVNFTFKQVTLARPGI